MKKIMALALLLGSSAFANIPSGHYVLEKIQCTGGNQLKLGGKFMVYNVTLDVTEGEMTMTAIAKSGKWAPFKLNCTQVNKGKFSYSGDSQYTGFLALDTVDCNAKMWNSILKRNAFGVEDEGLFDYTVNGNKLTISNPNTKKLYSCEDTNSIPVYHYIKK